MPHQIGYVEPAGGKLAHQVMLETIRDFAVANGWTQLLFDDSGAVAGEHYLILRAPGLSGTEEVFVGLFSYQNAAADFYNLAVAGFTGYVPGNPFNGQPGYFRSGVPAHNNRIDYWMTINGQRIACAMKVGTPVYESFYIGKFLPYARPSQYPYPLVVSGMLDGSTGTRFSETAHSVGFRGTRNNFRMRFNDGAWKAVDCWPWVNADAAGANLQQRDTGDQYSLNPVVLTDAQGLYGELDGVRHVTGFNNTVENTVVIEGKTWVVVQDVWRTGFNDYFAIRMD